ncbi:MAG: hypothetical protein KKB50_00145 [Planctomycetes bacterium]|nr:hypothetical protein [Planctomycetota bacterium]
MKIVAVQVGVLLAVVIVVVAIGYVPTQSAWGADGVASLRAATVICLTAALAATALLAAAVRWWPAYAGQAAFAGTTVRLLVTGVLAIAYQVLADVHVHSFLVWLLALYLPLMAVETVFGVLLVRRCARALAGSGEQ